MQHLITRDRLYKLCEGIAISAGDIVWIHHPITEDLLQVKVTKAQRDTVTVTILEDSPYYGQPDWNVKKINIIGVREK